MDPDSIQDFINLLRLDGDRTEVLGVWELVLALVLSLLCALAVTWAYRRTHRGAGYSQSFAHTIVIVSLVTTVIMVVVGSNIARAFSLLGALSVIRFRNAVKETRDVGFLFFAMAIAMAAGTRFYSVAILATAFIILTVLGLTVLDLFSGRGGVDRLLKVHLPPGRGVEETLGETLRTLFESYREARSESVQKGLYCQVTLLVRPKPGVTGTQVVEAIQAANDQLRVSYDAGEQSDAL